ncbi:MAG: S24/S26 family peptidase [Oscillospiraceae bacterium]|nr:S24/S26 family peptidase [Oscillospiraceae bacterium]
MGDTNKKKITLSELYPVIRERLDKGGTVELPITGTSMLPLLVWGRDSVDITKTETPKNGDIIFYRRDNGQFVLHRIIGENENGFILCGDNQWQKEYGIKPNNIIAVVTAINRNGKKFDTDNKIYRLYSFTWVKILPIRKYLLILMRKVKKLFGAKK